MTGLRWQHVRTSTAVAMNNAIATVLLIACHVERLFAGFTILVTRVIAGVTRRVATIAMAWPKGLNWPWLPFLARLLFLPWLFVLALLLVAALLAILLLRALGLALTLLVFSCFGCITVGLGRLVAVVAVIAVASRTGLVATAR